MERLSLIHIYGGVLIPKGRLCQIADPHIVLFMDRTAVKLFLLCDDLQPVSYTHLDVYKRQPCHICPHCVCEAIFLSKHRKRDAVRIPFPL